MTFTPISDGTTNWGFVLNAALNDIQAQVTAAQATANTGHWMPEDEGMIAWVDDPINAQASSATTSGVVHLWQVSVKKDSTITNIVLPKSANAATGVVGQNFAGIYSISGTRLGQTADITTNLAAGGAAPLIVPLSAQLPVAAGKYWIALLQNAGTPATFLRGAQGAGNYMNLVAASLRVATFGAALTALPSSITPTSMVASATSTIYAAIN